MAPTAPRCAHCGKQRATLKRCSTCKKASYCGAACQNAAWKAHKKTCVAPILLDDVLDKIDAALAVEDWRVVLEWEGRLEEMMEGQADDTCERYLNIFVQAHTMVGMAADDANSTMPATVCACGRVHKAVAVVSSKENHLSCARLLARRIDLLGKMHRFRDQGDRMFVPNHKS